MPVEVATAATGTTTMEITVSKFELLRELTATQGVVERKTTIPILSNYLFEAGGDKLSLTATDLDLSLRTSCSAKVKKEGSCTIPARKLHDYVKLLPDADITIKLLENHWVSIRCGRSNTKMVGMARSNFPTLPVFPTAGVVKIPAQVLRAMIAKTGFAIANEESRYTLNGALMVLKPESMTMVATDGHRLAHIERTGEKFEGVSGEMKTLIPKKAMDELKALVDSTDVEIIEFAKDESTLYFRIGPRLLTSRQLTGQFPNYEAVLPKDNNKTVTVNGDDLSAAVQRVAQFADERSRAVRLRLEKGELKISASSTEMGESEDSLETNYNGDALAIGFNAQYLLDFLKATGAGEVRLELKDPQSAGQMRPAEGDEYKYRYIVMPMRI
ncbi:MAG TPA: DNA polymerase III subunit beta [Terriglobales bacterium]|nr:DNA polymerase III subunit beta [Terriglobales bacterium]